jgi:hypothetical protein
LSPYGLKRKFADFYDVMSEESGLTGPTSIIARRLLDQANVNINIFKLLGM